MTDREPFLSAETFDAALALAAAHDLDWEVRQIANGKLKVGRLSMHKLAIVLSFVRAAASLSDAATKEASQP
jgi:RNA 3'-terminal phosphate cyclase